MTEKHYYAKTPKQRMKKLKVVEGTRVCKEPGCATVLSKYNQDPLCYLHLPPKKVRTRGKRSGKAADNMVDTTTRCYACALRLGGWGQPAEEVEFDGTFHWMVSIAGSATRLCDIR